MLRRLLALAGAWLAAPAIVVGQTSATPAVMIGAESNPGPGGSATRAAMFAPGLTVRRGSAEATAGAVLDIGTGIRRIRDASLTFDVPVARVSSWRGALRADASLTQPVPANSRWSEARLQLELSHGTASAGYRFAAGFAEHSTPKQRLVAPSVSSGVWLKALGMLVKGGVRFEILPAGAANSATMQSDTFAHFGTDSVLVPIAGTASPAAMRLAFSTNAALSARGTLAGMDLAGNLGAFFVGGAGTRPYGAFALTRWLTGNVGLTVGASRQVLDAVTGSAVTNAVFGIKLGTYHAPPRPPPSDAAVAALAVSRSGDSVTVAFHASSASQVELRGDLTGWQPVAMQRAEGQWWHAVLAAPAGIYRVDLRIDDRPWVAPAGVPHVTDPYAGQVGVVIVP